MVGVAVATGGIIASILLILYAISMTSPVAAWIATAISGVFGLFSLSQVGFNLHPLSDIDPDVNYYNDCFLNAFWTSAVLCALAASCVIWLWRRRRSASSWQL